MMVFERSPYCSMQESCQGYNCSHVYMFIIQLKQLQVMQCHLIRYHFIKQQFLSHNYQLLDVFFNSTLYIDKCILIFFSSIIFHMKNLHFILIRIFSTFFFNIS